MPEDWLFGLAAGALIGLAAALYLLLNGRIMGASDIVGGLVDGSGMFKSERATFLTGLVLVPGLPVFASGGGETYLTESPSIVIIAGLLVGVGTRLANGCTSGHSVCACHACRSGGL